MCLFLNSSGKVNPPCLPCLPTVLIPYIYLFILMGKSNRDPWKPERRELRGYISDLNVDKVLLLYWPLVLFCNTFVSPVSFIDFQSDHVLD
jgi:hypothetical protein